MGHAIVDGWQAGDGTIVTVMRDLGDAVVGWRGPITRSRCRRLLRAATAVHHRFAGQHVARLCPLERRLALFSPRAIAAAGSDDPFGALVARGWEYFAEIAPPGDQPELRVWDLRPACFVPELADGLHDVVEAPSVTLGQ